jgi:hypothetical protein
VSSILANPGDRGDARSLQRDQFRTNSSGGNMFTACVIKMEEGRDQSILTHPDPKTRAITIFATGMIFMCYFSVVLIFAYKALDPELKYRNWFLIPSGSLFLYGSKMWYDTARTFGQRWDFAD